MATNVDLGDVLDGLPDAAWTAFADGRADFINRRWCEYTGMSRAEGLGRGWWSAVHPDDLARVIERWSAFLETGSEGEVEARLRRFDGAYRRFLFRGRPLRDETGTIVRWCGTNIDIEDRTQAETQLAAEKHLLEMIASGCALRNALDAVCRFVEEISPDCLCGVYPIDWSGPIFQYGVAPSLPPSYVDPISGWPVREDIAPCGIAALARLQVVVPDIDADPLWGATGYRDHVVAHGVRSVWSTPISSLDGRVLGTFCIYQRKPATPSPRHQELISHATHIASIALNRAQADDALLAREMELRRAHAQLTEGQRLSKTGSFTADFKLDQHVWSEEFFRIFEIDPANQPNVQAVRDRVYRDNLSLFDAEIQRATDGGESDLVFRIVTPKAGVKHLRGATQVIDNVAGRPILMGAVQDVTESKLAEQALRRSEAYLVEGQRLTKAGSYFWLLEDDEPVLSSELCRIFRFEESETVTFKDIWDRIIPDDLPLMNERMETARNGHPNDFVFRMRMPDGSIKHLRSFTRGARMQSGRLELIGSVLDITESKLAEEALKASEAQLRRANRYLTEAQRMSRTGSFTWDPGRAHMDWSEEIYRILDFDPGEKPDMRRLANSVHPDDTAAVETTLQSAAMNGNDYEMFYRILTRGAGVKHLHTVGQRLPEITDRNVFVGATRDVTDSRFAEEALKASEAQLRRAYDYLTEAQRLSKTGSFTWDVLADVHNWSEEIRRIFGFDADIPVTMQMIQAAVHPDDMAEVERVIGGAAEGRNFDLVFRIHTTAGEVRYAHVVGHRIEDIADRPVFLGALQDVTDRVVGEEALNRARMELAHVSRVTALSALTASIAHEVNQPLAGIITNASTCLRMLAADPPNVEGAKATAQRTIRDANRAAEVIKRLRGLFARRSPSAEPLDLNDTAREVLALSSGELQGAKAILQTDFADDLPTISGDRVQLQQVILNLVVNAAQAMRTIDDRPRELRISTAPGDEGNVLFSVRDRGVGADVEHLEELFNAFYTTKPDGMGVGLSVSRSIVEAHGGRLWASANVGPGLTFSFSIPVAAVELFLAADGPPG